MKEPRGQKINPGAPSHISIYEKVKIGWKLVKKIDVNEKVLIEGQDFKFSEPLKLFGPNSKIAIDATLYHCSVVEGPCYIDEFQSVVRRSSAGKNKLTAEFFPTKEM